MNDEVVGIAVLEGDYLFVVCHSPSHRWVGIERIRAYPRGLPAPMEGGPAWAYWMENDRLCVSPSLHVRLEQTPNNWETLFHNAGTWSTVYQRVDKDGYDHCIEINADLMKQLRSA